MAQPKCEIVIMAYRFNAIKWFWVIIGVNVAEVALLTYLILK